MRPVAFFSRKLSHTERNYATTDRELLALLLAVKRFRPYLHGREVRVLTDHQPLVDMALQPGHPPRRFRWLEHLSAYDLRIEHVPGKENVVAGTLSCPPVDTSELFDVSLPEVFGQLQA